MSCRKAKTILLLDQMRPEERARWEQCVSALPICQRCGMKKESCEAHCVVCSSLYRFIGRVNKQTVDDPAHITFPYPNREGYSQVKGFSTVRHPGNGAVGLTNARHTLIRECVGELNHTPHYSRSGYPSGQQFRAEQAHKERLQNRLKALKDGIVDDEVIRMHQEHIDAWERARKYPGAYEVVQPPRPLFITDFRQGGCLLQLCIGAGPLPFCYNATKGGVTLILGECDTSLVDRARTELLSWLRSRGEQKPAYVTLAEEALAAIENQRMRLD